MSELGRLLTEARTAKNGSLGDVEAAIRVRQKYLEALEQGNYAALPPSAIARGFLRNYARYLGLDTGEILRLYTQESGDAGPIVPHADADNSRAIDYRPLEVTLMHEERGANWGRWLLALIIIAALVAGGWWLLNNRSTLNLVNPTSLLAALGPQATATYTATATRQRPSVTPPVAPPTAMALPVAITTTGTLPAPTPTSDLLTLPIPTVPPTATNTPTPRPTATPEPTEGISLTLKTTQRSWTKVTADGTVVLQDLLEAGQERGYPATQQMVVLTGNAGGVILALNGQSLGTMGTVGQVVERTWIVNAGQIDEVAPDQRTATIALTPAVREAPPLTLTPAPNPTR